MNNRLFQRVGAACLTLLASVLMISCHSSPTSGETETQAVLSTLESETQMPETAQPDSSTAETQPPVPVVAAPVLDVDYATHTLYAKNFPKELEYTWTVTPMVGGDTISSVTETEGVFTMTEETDNCKITLSVTGYDDLEYYNSSVPTISITGAAPNELVKDAYSEAHMTVYTTEKYQKTEYNDVIQIRARGNYTLNQPKRPFRLKLDVKTDLFGMGKSKHWVLLANYLDRTNLRNKLSYDFGASLGLAVCESTFVNVIYNGQYQGLYQLCETVRIAEDIVNITDWEERAEDVAHIIAYRENLSASEEKNLESLMKKNLSWITTGKFGKHNLADYYDISEFDITGGFLIENDAYYDEGTRFTTKNGMKMMVKEPDNLNTNRAMLQYIKDYIQNMEDAIYSPTRLSEEGKHYTEYLDIDSFLDFFMVNQLFKNVELFFKSCFMYKDVGGLLTFGPIWDMDWSSGNHVVLGGNTGSAVTFASWIHAESPNREHWYRALYNDPWFIVLLCERWSEIQGKIEEMMAQLDTLRLEIEDEAVLNSDFWKFAPYNAKREVNKLRTWLVGRQCWMDEQLASPDILLESLNYYIASERFAISAVTESGNGLELTVSVSDPETICSCRILVNGKVIRDEAIEDGSVITIAGSLLREAGRYNSIELLGLKEDGSISIVQPKNTRNGSDMADSACVFYLSK